MKFQKRIHQLKNGESVCIRLADAKDAAQVLELGKSVIREEIYSLLSIEELTYTVEEEAQWIKSMNDNPASLLIVAEVLSTPEDNPQLRRSRPALAHSSIVGMLDFTSGHRKRISHTGDFGMGVSSEWRGQGIGELLLNSLVEWVKEHPSLEKINLKVHSDNLRAIKLYEKSGFVKEGRLAKDLKYVDRYVDTFLMGKLVK